MTATMAEVARRSTSRIGTECAGMNNPMMLLTTMKTRMINATAAKNAANTVPKLFFIKSHPRVTHAPMSKS